MTEQTPSHTPSPTQELTYSNLLTEEEVAAESRGRIPPQAIMRLSSTWEMRCTVLCTNTTFSLLLTKSITVLVEWLKIVGGNKNRFTTQH